MSALGSQTSLETVEFNIKKDANRMTVKIAALVDASQGRFSAAHDALNRDTLEGGKEAARSLLAPCKDAIALLDLVSQAHPAISAVAAVFKIIVQLELDRQDNDRRIAVLYFQMTDLLFVLSYLNPVFEEEDQVQDKLRLELDKIKEIIDQFGNFCDVYYKHKSIVRTILSGKYKGRLAEFSERFSKHKENLQSLVSHKSAVNVSSIKRHLDRVVCKLDAVLEVIETSGAREEEVATLVHRYGGKATVLQNDRKLDQLFRALGEELTSSVKYALRSDLDDILEANVSMYNLKVEAIGRRIEDAIDRSTETVLLRLDSGPHDAIEDEDIRARWRNTCKVRHFVDGKLKKALVLPSSLKLALAVQHHYAKQFAMHHLVHGEPHPDKWTLHFISKVIFYPAIGDAIDADGSGFVSIHEVNRFFKHRPTGWKSSEWLAYWGIGWYRNAITYKKWCLQLLNSIEDSERMVHPGNLPFVANYLGKNCIGDIRLIVESTYTNTLSVLGQSVDLSHERFQFLRREKMEQEIEMVRSRLINTKFQIDSPLAVAAICGTSQLEHTFLCTLSVILMHHRQVIRLAEGVMISEQEFTTMVTTITNATTAFESRLNVLLECWRQQRIQARLQLQSFASGLFEDWWVVYYEDDTEDEDESYLADIRNYEMNPESDAEERDASSIHRVDCRDTGTDTAG
ncbi:hypothetical protein L218DRAFT_943538 [Marasmius fiardii PR-910]|nr:hypothetical protein L218DRAFT_943538 [Marasmius fiardii PR-910]